MTAKSESTNTPHEIELKLALPEGGWATVGALPDLTSPGVKGPEHRQERSVYFDTDDLALTARGLGLRVRFNGTRRVQTLKSARQGGGAAAARGEWECDITQDTPDVSRLAGTPAAATDAGALRPVWETSIARTVWRVPQDGSCIEIAADEGHVGTEESREPVRELELELKRGRVRDVYRLALRLIDAGSVGLLTEAKAARGLRLRTGQAPPTRKAGHVDLPDNPTGAQALHAILGQGIDHLLANHAAAIAGDKDGNHQSRVALRRLRSVLHLFAPLLDEEIGARFDADLRRLGQILGEARDWDVFATDTIVGVYDAGGLAPGASAHREAAHAAVADTLRGPDFARFVIGLAAWIEDGLADPGFLGDAALARPMAELAPALLNRVEKTVRKRGKRITQRDPKELHGLRKSLKKLRYDAEFLGSLYSHKEVHKFRGACEELQEVLGRLNDATVAVHLANGLDNPDSAAALARWADAYRAEAADHLKSGWRAFDGAEPFWR